MRRKSPRQPALGAEAPPVPLPTDPKIHAEILSGIKKPGYYPEPDIRESPQVSDRCHRGASSGAGDPPVA